MIRKVKIMTLGKNDKISNLQMSALLSGTMLGVGVLSLPALLADNLKTDGWVLLIINGIIASILVIIINKVARLYPGKTFIQFGKELVTAPVANIILIIFAVYLIGLGAFAVRIFAEVVKMLLLSQTPTEFIIITMLLTTSYIARVGIEGLARMVTIVLPIVLIPIILILISALPDLDYTNLLPTFRFSLTDLLKGIPTTFFSFIGFEFLLIYLGFVDKPKESVKYSLLSIGAVTFTYLVAFFVTLAQFGEIELTHQLWPVLSLMKTIQIPGAFIENIEGVVMAIWVFGVFTSLAPVLYGIAVILSGLFKAKEHNYFVLPVIPIIYVLSLVPDNLASVYAYMDTFTNYLGTFATIVVPVVFFIAALFKGKRKKEATDNG